MAFAFGQQRVAEWSAVVLTLLVLVGAFGYYAEIVQGEAEAAAIKSTLGSLRTAFVLDHLKQKMDESNGSVAVVQRNPFLLLNATPPNYVGDREGQGPEPLLPGTWVYDTLCICVGYSPAHSQWVQGADVAQTLWFRISAPPPPFQLHATQRYNWRGDTLN
jgi:hypothetical protein